MRTPELWPMKLGAYEIQGELGRGGMGVVFRGRAPDGRAVAIKLLKSGSSERFGRERRLLAELSEEEGFVPLLDAGDSPSGPWIAMPFFAGGTLRARLDELPLEGVPALGIALARALARAHERGIVHRDLKPENVLFTASGTPVIADLGLAKHFSTDAKTLSLSQGGELRGTIGYMPPEQLHDAKSVTDKADVFALGAILYEAVAGRPAFAGATAIEVLARVDRGEHEPLAEARPGAPPWLVAAIEACLAVDPAPRPSASELARVLEERRALAVAPRPRKKRPAALFLLGAIPLAAVAFALAPRGAASDPFAMSAGRAREALAEKRCGEALEHALAAQALADAARKDEVVALVARVHEVAVATSDWPHERSAFSALEKLGAAAKGADAHLLARILQDPQAPWPSELEELARRSPGARGPLAEACAVAWSRARTVDRIERLLEQDLLPPREERARVTGVLLEAVAKAPLPDVTVSTAEWLRTANARKPGSGIEQLRRPLRLFAFARRADPELDPFAAPALRLVATVRSLAHGGGANLLRPLVGLDPAHPVLVYVEARADMGKNKGVAEGVATVLASLEKCPRSRGREVLADSVLAYALIFRNECEPLAERFAALVSSRPEVQAIVASWRNHTFVEPAESLNPRPFSELEER